MPSDAKLLINSPEGASNGRCCLACHQGCGAPKPCLGWTGFAVEVHSNVKRTLLAKHSTVIIDLKSLSGPRLPTTILMSILRHEHADAQQEIRRSEFIRPVIVVPTHRNRPTPEETISLRQLSRVMSHREVVILTPLGIDATVYKDILPTASHQGIDPRWMSSHAAYNRLIISPLLSSLFKGYSHLLLCEPDSLLLSDSLDFWCQQPFDFVGAPWFQPNPLQEGDATFIPGANSGFSLFRLSAMRMVTSSWRRWYPVKHALGDLRSSLRGNGRQFRKGILGLYPGGLLRGAHRLYSSLCDQYWSLLVPRILPAFRVAPPEVAVRFAWEKWSHLCMEISRGHLPFGIHAWAKYDFDYLRPHLLAAGVDLDGMPRWIPPEWRKDWRPPNWPVGKIV